MPVMYLVFKGDFLVRYSNKRKIGFPKFGTGRSMVAMLLNPTHIPANRGISVPMSPCAKLKVKTLFWLLQRSKKCFFKTKYIIGIAEV